MAGIDTFIALIVEENAEEIAPRSSRKLDHLTHDYISCNKDGRADYYDRVEGMLSNLDEINNAARS